MSKENIQLFDLSLNKGDTCLTYVLKRLGLEEDLCSYETLHDHFDQFQFSRYKKKLSVGDILLWDRDIKWEWMPWIIKDKNIIWKNIPLGVHFGIMEDDDLFSDCTRLIKPPHPSLRIRRLNEVHKNPDWVLKLSK
jgi:hypothetical protein